jgi:serine/threonine-protein kinase
MTGSRASLRQGKAEQPYVSVGDVIAEKYRVEKVLGQGGMGFVVQATHLQLEERVALKFLHRSAMERPEIVSRFAQEARSAVKLKSEHVARVLDVGSIPDGSPFIIMEYLEGKDLAHYIDENGPLPVADAVQYVVQACEGLAEAHSRGIVHRDIKPDNLFLVERSDGWRSVKIVDFGISKAALAGAAGGNQPGHQTTEILGSPYYMSPEQLRSTKNADHRADVWSLGATLFELLAAATAFDEELQLTELIVEILEKPHRRLSFYRTDVPPELEAIIDRCLEKDREKRFQNTGELAIALLPFAPRRARLSVERAVSLARASEQLNTPGLDVPLGSDFPPPMKSDRLVTGRVSGQLSGQLSGRVPSGSLAGMASRRSPDLADTALAGSLGDPAPTSKKGGGKLTWVAALGVGFLVVGAAGYRLAKSSSPTASMANGGPASPPAAMASAGSQPAPSAVATQAPPAAAAPPDAPGASAAGPTATRDKPEPSAASASAAAAPAPARPAPAQRRVAAPAAAATPAAAAPHVSVTSNPDLEIRRER